jgi:hypothetical protein
MNQTPAQCEGAFTTRQTIVASAASSGMAKTCAVAGVFLFGAAVLVLFPPERYGFYPRCPFFETTGLLCPGCGGTRAVAALLRGDFVRAWKLNPLIVSLIPFALGYGFLKIQQSELKVPGGLWIGLAVLAVIFGVWRNIPH